MISEIFKSPKLSFADQVDLLKHCMEHNLSLEDELLKAGCGYESLQYRHSELPLEYEPAELSGQNLTLNDYDFLPNDIPVISFFSGAGGLDLGFERAGFHHLASIEINELFCETIRKNRSRWAVLGPPMHSGDIRNHDEFSHLLRQKIGITAPFEGVFHGGPPCQSFSVAANQRFSKSGDNFKRTGFSHELYGNLLFDFVWYICEFKPKVFIIENVAGLLGMDDGGQLREAARLLQSSGYEVNEPVVLNAAHYGVPQNRHRVFICGVRPTNGEHVSLPEPDPLVVPCITALKKPLDGVDNHLTRQHKADSVWRYMELRYGQRDPQGRVDRLNPNAASKTVIAGGAKGGDGRICIL